MSPSLPNPVSASPKLPRSRSSRAPGRGSTAEREGAASPGAAAAPAATAVAGGRLGPLDGVANAGLVAPEAAAEATSYAAGPPLQDPAAVRLLSSLHFSSLEREGRIRSDRVKERTRREEIRPLWYRAGLDLAATAAAFASTTTTTRSLPLAGRPRQPPPSSTGTASRQLDDRRSGRCRRRRLSSPSRLAGRGACYGVLGEPQ